ncbi:MAG: hypothetical protein EA402_02650 [Planctomycetota bacterium]|nr:MAG: hypothetical protein EA402_02650 [Planctomycetota bacterium]
MQTIILITDSADQSHPHNGRAPCEGRPHAHQREGAQWGEVKNGTSQAGQAEATDEPAGGDPRSWEG